MSLTSKVIHDNAAHSTILGDLQARDERDVAVFEYPSHWHEADVERSSNLDAKSLIHRL